MYHDNIDTTRLTKTIVEKSKQDIMRYRSIFSGLFLNYKWREVQQKEEIIQQTNQSNLRGVHNKGFPHH